MTHRRRLRRAAAASLIVLACVGLTACRPSARGVAATAPRMVPTHGESVPDLADAPGVVSVRSGRWSDSATWSTGRIPGDGDTVRVAGGTRVEYDIVSDARLRAVGVDGTLAFATDSSTRLRVTHLLVYAGGTLSVGDRQRPLTGTATAEIVFNNEPLATGTAEQPGPDPFQFGNGLLVWGTISMQGADTAPPFARLTGGVKPGQTSLAFEAAVTGWRPGDRVFLPDSRRITASDIVQIDRSPYNLEGSRGVVGAPQWEVAVIAAVEGNVVRLASPVEHAHPAADDEGRPGRGAGGALMAPHAANLSRNVVIRSESADGVRGHVICFRDATVAIANVAFRDLGRTTAAVLDGTQRDPSGRLVHIGTNQLARYPLHMHHLVDPKHVGADGFAFSLRGNVIEGGRRWGMSIHGSHYGLVQDNVVVDVDGAGIVTEDGSESGNRFEHNFVAAIRGSGQMVDARRARDGIGHEGAGYWFGSDNNIVVGNVAAGVRDGGFTLFRTPEAVPFPIFPERQTVVNAPVRTFEFSGNEVYGAAETGLELWDSKECKTCAASGPVLRDTTVWHSLNGVRYDYHADFYSLDGLVVSGDPRSPAGTTGVLANYSRRATIAHADIRFVDVGIDCGGSRNRVIEVRDTLVRAVTPLRIHRGTAWDDSGFARFTNVRLASDAGRAGTLVELDPGTYGKGSAKIAAHRPITFERFQGRTGSTFRVFYRDQSPDHEIPQNDDAVLGCPVAGLTNAACFERFGIAMGGELAPCASTTAGIDGFTCTDAPGPSRTR